VVVVAAQAAPALWAMPQLVVAMVVQDCHLTSAEKHNIIVEAVAPIQEWIAVLAALVVLVAVVLSIIQAYHTAVEAVEAMNIHKLTLTQY
jgi:hypothetical protein